MDYSDEAAKYKMIRLKACLQVKAEEAISKLGFSDEAYEEAKTTLKRRLEAKEDNSKIISKS